MRGDTIAALRGAGGLLSALSFTLFDFVWCQQRSARIASGTLQRNVGAELKVGPYELVSRSPDETRARRARMSTDLVLQSAP